MAGMFDDLPDIAPTRSAGLFDDLPDATRGRRRGNRNAETSEQAFARREEERRIAQERATAEAEAQRERDALIASDSSINVIPRGVAKLGESAILGAGLARDVLAESQDSDAVSPWGILMRRAFGGAKPEETAGILKAEEIRQDFARSKDRLFPKPRAQEQAERDIAQADGVLGTLGALVRNPLGSAQLAGESLASSLPAVRAAGVIAGSGLASSVEGANVGDEVEAEFEALRASPMYETLRRTIGEENLRKAADQEKARRIQQTMIGAGLGGAATAGLTSRIGLNPIDEVIAGRTGALSSRVPNTLKELGGEFIEGAGTQASVNLLTGDDIGEDVLKSGVTESALGGLTAVPFDVANVAARPFRDADRIGDQVRDLVDQRNRIDFDPAIQSDLARQQQARDTTQRVIGASDEQTATGALAADRAIAEARAARPTVPQTFERDQLIGSDEVDRLLTGGINEQAQTATGRNVPDGQDAGRAAVPVPGYGGGLPAGVRASYPGDSRSAGEAVGFVGDGSLGSRDALRPAQFTELGDGTVFVPGDPVAIRQRLADAGVEGKLGVARTHNGVPGVRFGKTTRDVALGVLGGADVQRSVALPSELAGRPAAVSSGSELGAGGFGLEGAQRPQARGMVEVPDSEANRGLAQPAQAEAAVDGPSGPGGLRDIQLVAGDGLAGRGSPAVGIRDGDNQAQGDAGGASFAGEYLRSSTARNVEDADRAGARARFRQRISPAVRRDQAVTQKLQSLKQSGQLSDEQIALVRETLSPELSVGTDRVTTFFRSEDLPETMQAAQQYVTETNDDAAYAEIDFANLGGLNAVAGNAGADTHLAAVTRIIKEGLEAAGVDGAVNIRKGGDEFGIVAAGIDAQTLGRVMMGIRQQVAAYADAQGLSGIAHGKDKSLPPGIGIHFATSDIQDGLTVDEIRAQADTLVEARKKGKAGYDEYAGPDAAVGSAQGTDAGSGIGVAAATERGTAGQVGRAQDGAQAGAAAEGGVSVRQAAEGDADWRRADRRGRSPSVDGGRDPATDGRIADSPMGRQGAGPVASNGRMGLEAGDRTEQAGANRANGGVAQVRSAVSRTLGSKFLRRLESQPWFNLVESLDQLPPDVRKSISGDDIAGFVLPDGRVFIIAENVGDNATGIVLHEVGVHFGMSGLPDFPAILAQFKRLRAKDGAVGKAYESVPEDTPANLVDEEALAYYVEQNWNADTPLMRRIWDAVVRLLNRLGIPMSTLADKATTRNVLRGMIDKARAAANDAAAGLLPAVNRVGDKIAEDGPRFGRGRARAEPDMPSATDEKFSDVVRSNANKLGNLLVSDSGVIKSLGELNVPSRTNVLAVVRGLLQDREILDSVVRFVPVDVVNVLAGQELPADALLDNPAMLVNLLPVDANDLVSSNISAVDKLISNVAFAAAKVFPGLGRLDVFARDGRSAVSTIHSGRSDAGLRSIANRIFDDSLVEVKAKYSRRVQDGRIRRTVAELTNAADSMRTWRDWYDRHDQTLQDVFGDDAALFQKLLSATSQAASVPANIGLALKAYRQLLSGEPFVGYLPAVIKNLERVAADEALRGQKISEYGSANEGSADAIAVDRHIAMLFFNTKSPNRKQVASAKARIRAIAERLGWQPREAQAALWAYNQTLLGTAPEDVKSYDKLIEAQRARIDALRSSLGRGQDQGAREVGRTAGRDAVPERDAAAGRGEVGAKVRYSRQSPEARGSRADGPYSLRTVTAGDVVDGRTVREDVPNQSSIASSLDDYTILKGIREVPMAAFDKEYVDGIAEGRIDKRTQALADAIAASKEIAPLIVAYDADGAYIIEGGHRFDALIKIGAKSLPAMVVIDESNPPNQSPTDSRIAYSRRTPTWDSTKDAATQAADLTRRARLLSQAVTLEKGAIGNEADKRERIRKHGEEANRLIAEFDKLDALRIEKSDADVDLRGLRTMAARGDRKAIRDLEQAVLQRKEVEDEIAKAKAAGGRAAQLLNAIDRTQLRDVTPMISALQSFSKALGIVEDAAEKARKLRDWWKSREQAYFDAFETAKEKRGEAAVGLGVQPPQTGAIGYTPTKLGMRWEGAHGVLRRRRRELQDQFISWRDVQGDIAKAGGLIDELNDVYTLENLMHGRTADQLRRGEDAIIKPLQDVMVKHGIRVAELEDYLEAVHAKPRNASVRKVNPKNDSGSGMTDAEADAYLAGTDAGHRSKSKLTAERKKQLQEAEVFIRQLVQKARDRLLETGVITKEMHAALSKDDTYVPLRHIEKSAEGDDAVSGDHSLPGIGSGLDVRSHGVKRALGRTTRAENILGEVIGNWQRAVILGEKNRVGQAILRMALQNPIPGVMEAEKVETELKYSEATGQAYMAAKVDTMDPNTIAIFVDGKRYHVKLEERLARAAKRLNAEPLGKILSGLHAVNRVLANLYTSFSLTFALVNPIRDLTAGLARVAGDKGVKIAADAAANWIPARAAIRANMAGRTGGEWTTLALPTVSQATRAKWVKYADEATKAGFMSGFTHALRADAIQDSMVRRLKNAEPGAFKMTARGAKAVLDYVQDVNQANENAFRLATYVALREAGETAQAAAQFAKNVTVNFNRKGELSAKIGAYSLFFNAAVQGSHAVVQTLKSKKVMAAVATVSAAAAALAFMGMDDRDEETGERYWDLRLTDSDKQRNFIIPTGGGDFIKIPLPYGLNVFPYTAVKIAEGIRRSMEGEEVRTAETVGSIGAAAANSFMPVDLNLLSAFPTAVRPIAEARLNENFFGSEVHPDEAYDKYETALADKYFPGTSAAAIALADAARWVGTLGDTSGSVKPWFPLDWSPNDLEYMAAQYTGGPGKMFSGVVDATLDVLAGGAPSRDNPMNLANVVMTGGRNPDREVSGRYRERSEMFARLVDQGKDIYAAEGRAAWREFQDKHKQYIGGVELHEVKKAGEKVIEARKSDDFAEAFKDAEREIRKLRAEKRQAYNDQSIGLIDRKRRTEAIDKEIAELQKEALRDFNSRR